MLLPLEGLRVLDLTDGIAGAYCAKLLVDAGAEAIKVEPPGGDRLRSWWCSGRGDEPPGTGALFEWLQASKRSVVADVETEVGRELIADLAADADVMLESYPVGQIESLGLGHPELLRRQPRLVLVSISDFGRGVAPGPVGATELTLQALAGSVHARGDPNRFPVMAGGQLGSWSAGLYAAVGALAAFREARRSGIGEHVDVSRLESMVVTLMGYAAMMRSIGGEIAKPYTRFIEIPCVEQAVDGWIGYCVVTNAQWQAFALMIGHVELAEGEWSLAAYRQAHREELQGLIDTFTMKHTVAELLEEAAMFRVPAAPIVGGAHIPEIEPFASLRMYVEAPNGRFRAPRPPYHFSRCSLRPLGSPPLVGEHNGSGWSPVPKAPPSTPQDTPGAGPFAGVKVIDFTAFWAGPYATGLLAGLGADVIKVESISRPDPIRYSSSVPPSDPLWFEKSAVFGSCNANKRGITLELDTPVGRDLALRLVAGADVVIENFTPRVMERFGLDYPDLSAVNPGLVMVRMSAFGAHGPWRDRPGFAQTMEQISGLAWITGYEDARPLVVKGVCDPVGGLHAALAVMMALEHRDRTGEGQLVELSMLETSANVAAEVVIEASAYGRDLMRDGNHGPEGAPQGVYRCQGEDAWIAVSVVTDGQWRDLVEALGAPKWARDPVFDDVAGRRERGPEIDAHLSVWAANRQAQGAAELLRHHGVPAAVAMAADRVDEVPQLKDRGFWISIDHPAAGVHDAPGWPMQFLHTNYRWPGRPAPLVGEHNAQVLSEELGLGADEIADLEVSGIVGQRIKGM